MRKTNSSLEACAGLVAVLAFTVIVPIVSSADDAATGRVLVPKSRAAESSPVAPYAGASQTVCLQRLTASSKSSLPLIFELPSFGLVAVVGPGYGEVSLQRAGDASRQRVDHGWFGVHTGGVGGGVGGVFEAATPNWLYALGYSVKLEEKEGHWRFTDRVSLPIRFTDHCDSASACAVSNGDHSPVLKSVFFSGRQKPSIEDDPNPETVEVVGPAIHPIHDPDGKPFFYEGDATGLGRAIVRNDEWLPYAYDGVNPPQPIQLAGLLGGPGSRWTLRDKPEIGRTEFYSVRAGYSVLEGLKLRPETVPPDFLGEVPTITEIPGSGMTLEFLSTKIYRETPDGFDIVGEIPAGVAIDLGTVRYVRADNSIRFQAAAEGAIPESYRLWINSDDDAGC